MTSSNFNFAYVWKLFTIMIQYFLCGYTFISTIIFSCTLFNYYVYFADHEWCYYSMVINVICFFTAIAFNFMYTFYFIKWINTNIGIEFDMNYIFFYTGNRSPLTIMKKEGKGKYHKAYLFLLYSFLKIIDIIAYTNSSLVMFIMAKPIGIYTEQANELLKHLSEKKKIIVDTMKKKMYLTTLISLVILDIPQGIISINSISRTNQIHFDVKNIATIIIVKTILLILYSTISFIYGYFFETKKAVRDSEIKLINP